MLNIPVSFGPFVLALLPQCTTLVSKHFVSSQ